MNRQANRDLLVLFKEELMSPQALEHEVELLHEMLFRVESLENVSIAYEVIDLNRYKLIGNPAAVRDIIRRKNLKPFVFLNNKN